MLVLRTVIFTLLVPGSVAVWIPHFLLRLVPRPLPIELTGWRAVGLLLGAAGIAIYLWCAWDFAAAGRGTPAPWDAPREFVARGLYRYTRNPMYVGVLLVLLGEALLFASRSLLGYALAVGLVFHLVVLLYEEPTLRRQFGAAYEAYCRRVPRWPGGLRRMES